VAQHPLDRLDVRAGAEVVRREPRESVRARRIGRALGLRSGPHHEGV